MLGVKSVCKIQKENLQIDDSNLSIMVFIA